MNNIVSCDEPTKIGHFFYNKMNFAKKYNTNLNILDESDFKKNEWQNSKEFIVNDHRYARKRFSFAYLTISKS